MMAWTTADIPDLSGKTAVVTGANAGLGLETAKGLAGAGCHVVMAARNREKADRAFTELTALHPGASLEIVELDLASLQSIETAALAIFSSHPTVDILVNNAGLMAMPELG
jgi:NAD(P)-dependent dehydrogenase (short-subunit alcohol dehydrogenase family)